jgi:cysteine desulfuration protein SufE
MKQASIGEIVENFDLMEEWDDRYRYLIELGRTLPPLPEDARTEANKVRGCASQVWLVTERAPDGRLVFRAESDAQIPHGLIAVLLKLYSGRRPDEIRALDPQAAVERLELGSMLTSQRANGLAAMVERIRKAAAEG